MRHDYELLFASLVLCFNRHVNNVENAAINGIEFTVKRFAGIFARRRRATANSVSRAKRHSIFFEKYNRKHAVYVVIVCVRREFVWRSRLMSVDVGTGAVREPTKDEGRWQA